jgi:hypothetical protein
MRWISLFGGIIITSTVTAQTTGQSTSLAQLFETVGQYYKDQSARAQEYSRQHGIPLRYVDQFGNIVQLTGLSEDGSPKYESTCNVDAAITTGAIKLQASGGMGLKLEGEGLELGIWDGGVVDSHIEFQDRILLREGTSEDNHATHVTGTLLAAGINPQAKGMAPKVKAYVYDFINDTPEMITMSRSDQTGLIISNHSYGLLAGWNFNNGWQWNGNVSISNREDWRFGFYSNTAAQWDQLSVNAPYYLIVKSAGNDRNDVGNGTFPPDCNGGSGYDCIADKGVAKNILTVGAVNKATNYEGPESVVMSPFSAWGPTDDGRIKPDVVAAGVNVYSTTASATNDSYGSLSGTSMAAPNATGSLLLLQELYGKLHSGKYMRSATLKALALHAAREAGPNPGPDYQFGWGLLDVEGAAKILLSEDQINTFIIEEDLANEDVFELVLTPKANTKITATLVWNDPAATPLAASLDPVNIMLVNDLDMRIRDGSGNEKLPWILDPNDPSAPATTGDNFRDNVEKIEFADPEEKAYKLLIKHKKTLTDGHQPFSLIVQYTSVSVPLETLYWIGTNADWNFPGNWSFTSGGVPANKVPSLNTRVVFDENSFLRPIRQIELSSDVGIHSMLWLSNEIAGLALNKNTLSISGNLITSSGFSVITEGIIRFTGHHPAANYLHLSSADFSNARFIFESEPEQKWIMSGSFRLGAIDLIQGQLLMSGLSVQVSELTSASSLPRLIDLTNTVLSGVEKINLWKDQLTLLSSGARVMDAEPGPSRFQFTDADFSGEIAISGNTEIITDAVLNKLHIAGVVSFSGNATIADIEAEEGAIIKFLSGTRTTFSDKTIIRSTASKKTKLEAQGAEPATILFDGHYKLCFDHLVISNVTFEGSALVNAGKGSELINSANWLKDDCNNILFADFEIRYPCVNAMTEFVDKSTGAMNTWSWNFGDPSSPNNNSSLQNPFFIYKNTGSFLARLTISNGTSQHTYSTEVTITDNPLPVNKVLLTNNVLFSQIPASGYVWYKDNLPLPNSNTRSFDFKGTPGAYFVQIREGNCNRPSESFIITATEETPESFIEVYPVPASDNLVIELPYDGMPAEAVVRNAMGLTIKNETLNEKKIVWEVVNWPKGIYFLELSLPSKKYVQKIIIY